MAFQSVATNLLEEQNAPPPDPPGGGGRADTNNVSDIFQHVTNGETDVMSVVSNFSPYTQADGASTDPAISENGGHVAFTSAATNLLGPGVDSNNTADIYVRKSSGNVRVSVSTSGTQAIGVSTILGILGSYEPSISTDGRYVAFYSYAANLVSGDTNARTDIFVRDRDTDGDAIYDEAGAVSTTRASLATGGAQADGYSYSPAISAHGRYVAFESEATNLVSGDTLGNRDIFVRDRLTNQTTRVSVAADGTEANGDSINPSISADGSYIAFESAATNLVSGDTLGKRDVFVRYVGFSSTFPIAISPVNDAPTVASIANQSVALGQSTPAIAFSIGDADDDVASLTVEVSSSNPGLVPASAVVLGGSGASRTLTITPAPGPISGPTDVIITVKVGDGAATTPKSFTLTVIPYQVRVPLAIR
jgi:Tol biopolymer transport system component